MWLFKGIPCSTYSGYTINVCIVCEVSLKNKKGYIVSLYKSPSQSHDDFKEFWLNLRSIFPTFVRPPICAYSGLVKEWPSCCQGSSNWIVDFCLQISSNFRTNAHFTHFIFIQWPNYYSSTQLSYWKWRTCIFALKLSASNFLEI